MTDQNSIIDILSIVSFPNSERVSYLEKSFGSFYQFNLKNKYRHIVIDGSLENFGQEEIYKKYSVQYFFIKETYSKRLKIGLSKIKNEYFLFMPDDYRWIIEYPFSQALEECKINKIHELKLVCRGMDWFSQKNPTPLPWHLNGKVISGEQLYKKGNLYISNRKIIKNFHENFSIGCHIINLNYINRLIKHLPSYIKSPSEVEKYFYLIIFLNRLWCRVAYYKMIIPAFHFATIEAEPYSDKFKDMLINENTNIYNNAFNLK